MAEMVARQDALSRLGFWLLIGYFGINYEEFIKHFSKKSAVRTLSPSKIIEFVCKSKGLLTEQAETSKVGIQHMQSQKAPTTVESSVADSKRNYHYLRYAILGMYLVVLGTLPNWLQSEYLPLKIVAGLGVAVTVLCIIMDLRNYYLFRQEEAFIRHHLGRDKYSWSIVTLALLLFYSCGLLLFFYIASLKTEKKLVLTPEGDKRLGVSTIATKDKLHHMPSGWTIVKGSNNVNYLVRNDEIKEIHNGEQ